MTIVINNNLIKMKTILGSSSGPVPKHHNELFVKG